MTNYLVIVILHIEMAIRLIRNEGCHIWATAEKALREALKKAGMPQDFEIIVVKDAGSAKQYRFFGSPQITIDGVDIDPQAAKATQFQSEGCRIYIWEGRMYEYPPKEMIFEALKTT